MRRIERILLCLILLMAPMPRLALSAAHPVHVSVRVASANLRSEPKSGARVLTIVRQGDLLTVLGDVPYWYKVETHEGLVGWIAKSLTEVVLSPPDAARSVASATLRIVHFDVDQGDSALIIAASGRTLLFDAGDTTAHGRRIANYLHDQNLSLSYLVVSHFHKDHIGGVPAVVAGPDGEPGQAGFDDDDDGEIDEVDEFGASDSDDQLPTIATYDRGDTDRQSGRTIDNYLDAVGETRQSFTVNRIGQRIEMHDPELEVRIVCANGRVWGGNTAVPIPRGREHENDRSLGILVRYRGFDELICGDLTGGGDGSTNVEVSLATTLSTRNIHIDVYKANHHGSRTSSNPAFLELIRPEVVVCSLGDHPKRGAGYSQYGHPHQEFLDALNALQPRPKALYQTHAGGKNMRKANDPARDYGNLKWFLAGGDIEITTDGRTYWVNYARLASPHEYATDE